MKCHKTFRLRRHRLSLKFRTASFTPSNEIPGEKVRLITVSCGFRSSDSRHTWDCNPHPDRLRLDTQHPWRMAELLFHCSVALSCGYHLTPANSCLHYTLPQTDSWALYNLGGLTSFCFVHTCDDLNYITHNFLPVLMKLTTQFRVLTQVQEMRKLSTIQNSWMN
jgi:hypothetical protein